jgi:hypothetical protein
MISRVGRKSRNCAGFAVILIKELSLLQGFQGLMVQAQAITAALQVVSLQAVRQATAAQAALAVVLPAAEVQAAAGSQKYTYGNSNPSGLKLQSFKNHSNCYTDNSKVLKKQQSPGFGQPYFLCKKSYNQTRQCPIKKYSCKQS